MAAGRIQCLLISTVTGHVVYERFYDAFTEMEKAHIRESFDATVIDESLVDNQELVGRFKCVSRSIVLYEIRRVHVSLTTLHHNVAGMEGWLLSHQETYYSSG
jgi:hypothetical protein